MSSDFRDEEGYPIVGGRCALFSCNSHDFLPFDCPFCKASFCQFHKDPSEHDCQKVPDKVGIQASFCPSCQETLRWHPMESTEAEALEIHKSSCKGLPPKRSRCPAAGCDVVLGLTNAVTCKVCKQKVCMTHRFEDSHPCHAQEVKSEGSSATASMLASPAELRALRKGLEAPTARIGECLYAIRRRLSGVCRESNFEMAILRCGDLEVREKILSVRGAEELLQGIGFEENEKDGTWKLSTGISKGRIEMVMQVLL
eukprot:TRINITY_DN12123_c0_g1_i3.p1 TRINITY_DN12123_c0_g1~~TRINITY_DN12123_c0_g1_i3.p1  ORF type:complete len:256 (+),score=46.69 TRINITY_DN12123_c0_g1_i3:66-833(+)